VIKDKINKVSNTVYSAPAAGNNNFQQKTGEIDIRTQEEGINNLIYYAALEAINKIKFNKSLFFDESTPQDVKKGIGQYVGNFSIILENLKVPYGNLDSKSLNEKTPRLEFTFSDFVNFFIFILSNTKDYNDLIESVNPLDLLMGNVNRETVLKISIIFRKIGLQYFIGSIQNHILYRLGANDGITAQEAEILDEKSALLQDNLDFNYRLNKVVEFMITANPGFTQEAQKSIYYTTAIQIPKAGMTKTRLQELLNFFKIDVKQDYAKYNYNLYYLKQNLANPDYIITNVTYGQLSKESFGDFQKFVQKSNIANNNPNFFVGEGKDHYYIIPRYNPINQFETGTIADKFTDPKVAEDHGAKILAHQYLDDKIASVLSKNNSTIKLFMTVKGVRQEYSSVLGEFFNRAGIFSFDVAKTKVDKSVDQFFGQVNQVLRIALIEAISLYRTRTTEINKADSNLVDYNNSKIIIGPIRVQSLTNETAFIETAPIEIKFSTMVYMILQYLEANMFSLVDSFDEILKKLQSDEKFQQEFTIIMADLLMKNIIVSALKRVYVVSLYNLENFEKLDKEYLSVIKKIAINTMYGNEYIYRLIESKKAPLQGTIEENRQTVYCLQILCPNKEIKDSHMGIIGETVNGLGNERNINNLRNELISKQIAFKSGAEPYHLYFNQIPLKLQEEYLKFLEDKNSPNFFVGVYNYYERMKSGVQYVIYIIPKYDIRDINNKPGVFEQDVKVSEMAVVMNNELYPYFQEILKTNKDNTVIIKTVFNQNDGKNSTKTNPIKLVINLGKLLPAMMRDTDLDSSMYINNRRNPIAAKAQAILNQLYLTQDQILQVFYKTNEKDKNTLLYLLISENSQKNDENLLIMNKEDVVYLSTIKNLEELKAFNRKLIAQTQAKGARTVINILDNYQEN
jgi:hypothetical protein